MGTIFQQGCFGTRNYGDELSAIAVREMLRTVYPEARIAIIGCSKKALDEFHDDADERYTYGELDAFEEEFRDADLWVYGPGTIMGEPLVGLASTLIGINKRVAVWGVGTGQPSGKALDIIQNASPFTVRDHFSLNMLRPFNERTALVPDPMFLVRVPNLPKSDLNGITISSNLFAESKADQSHVLKCLAETMRQVGGSWIGLPASWNFRSLTVDNDLLVLDRLAKLIPMEVYEPYSFANLTEKLAGLNLYISSRLHTAIVALSAGVKTVLFGYQKCFYAAETLGIPGAFAGAYRSGLPGFKQLATRTLMQSVEHSIDWSLIEESKNEVARFHSLWDRR